MYYETYNFHTIVWTERNTEISDGKHVLTADSYVLPRVKVEELSNWCPWKTPCQGHRHGGGTEHDRLTLQKIVRCTLVTVLVLYSILFCLYYSSLNINKTNIYLHILKCNIFNVELKNKIIILWFIKIIKNY